MKNSKKLVDINLPWFLIGFVHMLVIIAILLWVYINGIYNNDYTHLYNWLLPTLSSFACGSLIGSTNISSKIVLLTASIMGGLAVWSIFDYVKPDWSQKNREIEELRIDYKIEQSSYWLQQIESKLDTATNEVNKVNHMTGTMLYFNPEEFEKFRVSAKKQIVYIREIIKKRDLSRANYSVRKLLDQFRTAKNNRIINVDLHRRFINLLEFTSYD